jgi:hypothetical protein
LLDGSNVLLQLPAAEPAAVVLDADGKACHVDR